MLKWGVPSIIGVFFGLLVSGCGVGNKGAQVPTPIAPGEVITVALCGSTTEPRSPCGDQQNNVIQIRVNNNSMPATCPCFNFSFLNQALTDLGASQQTTYEFTGFRPGTYQVTGQTMIRSVTFQFVHNASTSAIGVVPSSIQSLSGPASATNESCRIGYTPSASQLPASFSFQFTIAAETAGGSC